MLGVCFLYYGASVMSFMDDLVALIMYKYLELKAVAFHIGPVVCFAVRYLGLVANKLTLLSLCKPVPQSFQNASIRQSLVKGEAQQTVEKWLPRADRLEVSFNTFRLVQ